MFVHIFVGAQNVAGNELCVLAINYEYTIDGLRADQQVFLTFCYCDLSLAIFILFKMFSEQLR